MDPTHKIVNGERINLTQDEINSIKESWRIEDEKRAQRKIIRENKNQNKIRLKGKLKSLGLSEDEISLVIT